MSGRPAFPEHPGQRGLATYRQLREAGWTEAQIRHARTTNWQRPFPSVVAPHRGPLDEATWLAGAALWAGPRAVLTGTRALRELGLLRDGRRRATFLVPATARARSTGTVRTIRTTRTVPLARRSSTLRIASAPRALVDAAVHERVGAKDLEALAIRVLQRGLGTPDDLEHELWQHPQTAVSAVRKGLEAFVGGAWSRPEGVLRTVVDGDPRMPELLTNVRLETVPEGVYVGCPDGYLPDVGVAIQVHSRQHHQGVDDQGGDRWADTVEKDSDFVAVGVRVVGVTPWTLYAQPRRFLDKLHKVVALGPPSPFPAVRVVPVPAPPDGAT